MDKQIPELPVSDEFFIYRPNIGMDAIFVTCGHVVKYAINLRLDSPWIAFTCCEDCHSLLLGHFVKEFTKPLEGIGKLVHG